MIHWKYWLAGACYYIYLLNSANFNKEVIICNKMLNCVLFLQIM